MPSRSLARSPRFTPFQLAVHLGAWLPALWLGARALTGQLGANPVQAATQFTGLTAVTLLLLSLACTPLHHVFGFQPAGRARRPLGLYAFFYAVGHVYLFLGVDYQFNLDFIAADLPAKPYIWAGAAAGLILLALAVTSLPWLVRRLGRNWPRLQRLVYLAGGLAILHFGWAQKGNLFALRGDVGRPLAYGGVLAVLMLLRVPPVAYAVRRLWQRLRPPREGRDTPSIASER